MHKVLKKSDLPTRQSRTVRFEGEHHGSEISFFFVDNDPGQGPTLHVHPYSETWLVLSGEALFTADGNEVEAGEGDIVLASSGTPHKFRNTGSGRLQVMCVHASSRIIQEDLEED